MRFASLACNAAAVALSAALCGCVSSGPDFRDTIAQAKAAVFPSVVYVRVIYDDLESGKNRQGVASGSGVVISSDGEVLTNHHVVDKTTEIRCQLADGRSFDAKVVGKDKDLDIALLKLQLPDGTPPLPVADLSTRRLEVGEVVLAMGAPWGLARSVSMGIVSCNDRFLEGAGDYTLWYQTDAAISPGNSGGPLVDTSGRVVGINARGNLFGGQAFTIPSSTVLDILPNLRKFGEAHWAWFGFKLQPLEDFNRNMRFDAREGAIVADVEPGGPALKAGLKPNDRIVSVDGAPVTARFWEDIPTIQRVLALKPLGRTCVFGVVRGGGEMKLEIAAAEKGRVEGESFVCARWGFTAKEINRFDTPDLAFFAPDGGVFISALAWDGNAENCGFNEKDVIVRIGERRVKTLKDVKDAYSEALAAIGERTKAAIEVSRGGRPAALVLDYAEDTEKEDY